MIATPRTIPRSCAIAAAAALLLAGAADAQQAVNIRRAAKPDVSVRLMGQFASLTVSQWQHDSIALTGGVGAGTRLDGGGLNPSGPVTGMKFYVEAPEGTSISANRLELRVPREARVWVKGGSADVVVNGVAGGLDINVIGGSVHVTGKPRDLLVESMDGSVTFSGYAGFARIKTATGNITLQDGGGDDLHLNTVSGAIRVQPGERELQRGRFESVTGPVSYAGRVDRGADLRFDSHSGAIELRLSRPASMEVDAITVTGGIENSWSSARPIAGREGRGMELGFSSGTAGARISIRSFRGNVKLAPM